MARSSIIPGNGHRAARRSRRPRRPHLRVWDRSRHRRQGLFATLVLLDDDPVLMCECADGEPHSCRS
ncbi:MAG: hypothetical protein JJU45_14265 [Acidimicrobiia bacterium]|nr:hypothetical protein [Acidimicrobiia bacterium]